MKQRKILKCMLLALLAFMPGWANADTYTVYGGTGQAPDSSQFVPLDFYNTDFNYCRTQFTYSYAEVSTMNDKVITGLKFFGNTSDNGSNYQNIVVKVKLGIVTTGSFSSAAWKTDMTQTTLFGKVTRSGNNVIISFNTGYYLNINSGESLLIELENVNKARGQYFGSTTRPFRCYGKNWSNNFSAYKSSSSAYPVMATPTLSSFTPKCEFTYYSKDIDEPCVNWNCYGRTSHADEWISLNGNGRNVWIVGDSAGSRINGNSHCLYVSGYPTLGNSYSNNSTSAFIYRYITLEPNTEYVVSYDWRCNGEFSYDFMRVGLVSASVSLTTAGMTPGTSSTNWTSSSLPTGVIALDGGSKLNHQNSWQHKSIRIKTSASGTQYRFVVYWRNDNSTSNASAAAIDNITIMPLQIGAFHEDFEGDYRQTWCRDRGSGNTFWSSDNDIYYSGNKSMYVGEDSVHNYGYNTSHSDTSLIFFPIRLKAGQYLVSYNWQGLGDGNNDYMRIGMTEFNNIISAHLGVPDNNIACDGDSCLSGQTSWQYKSTTVTVSNDTIYYFYLMWVNDSSSGNPSSSAAVDNLSISKIVTTMPVTNTFDSLYWNDSERWYWTLANGIQAYHWVHGNQTFFSGNSLYICNDTNENLYSTSNTSSVFASYPINMNSGKYSIQFKYKNNSVTNADFLRATLIPENVCIAPGDYNGWDNDSIPYGAIEVSPRLYGQNNYQDFSCNLSIPTTGIWRLVFIWHNTNGSMNQYSASIDNISISLQTFSITSNSNDSTMGETTGNGIYYYGDTATLLASAYCGFRFDHWSDGTTDNPHRIVVSIDTVLTAMFVEDITDTLVDCCDYYITNSGNIITTNGIYYDTTTSSVGCDSIVVIHLTVNHSDFTTETLTVCDSLTWHENVFSESDTVSQFITTNAYGCDSVIALNLTVNHSSAAIETVTACDSFTWWDMDYTNSTYDATHTMTNMVGCDSTVTLHLTINYSSSGNTTVVACDSLSWYGTTYTASGTHWTTLTNVAGCDSVETLNLTIIYSNNGTDVQTACDSYTWHGNIYNESTTSPTFIEQNSVGCDSIVTLHLTINYSSTGDTSAVVCDSFTWWDTNFTNSEDEVTHVMTNIAGCDSVVTLHLTVNYSTTGTDVQSACDEFVWIDSVTYTESNFNSQFSTINLQGCDSTVTLNLTLIHSVTVYDSLTLSAGDVPYNYHGNTVTVVGDYSFNGTTTEGCDSITLLHVEILESIDVNDLMASLKVYPNPTHGTLTIATDDVLEIEVLDLNGFRIASFENVNTIDITNLAAGCYMLHIQTTRGNTVRRIVKK